MKSQFTTHLKNIARQLQSNPVAQILRATFLDAGGMVAVEFALLIPVMLTMYFGTLETTNAMTAARRVTNVAQTAGDLTAQVTNVTTADMNDIFAASTAIVGQARRKGTPDRPNVKSSYENDISGITQREGELGRVDISICTLNTWKGYAGKIAVDANVDLQVAGASRKKNDIVADRLC